MATEINRVTSTVTVSCMNEIMPVIKECLQKGQSVRFSPRGISMLPMLRQGIDTVTLSPITGDLKKYDIALYVRANGKHVLHRVVKVEDTYTCCGDNQYVYEKGIFLDQFVGVVTSFTRSEKEYSVNNTGYRLYYRIWHYSRFFRRVIRAVFRRIKNLFHK
ncbi:MAG: S24/S26 family peptidase [Clostridia bacterium]|nr:S24/S26 family peptidase [Clostridia bacterium]